MSLDKNHDAEMENVFIEKDGERIVARYPISDKTKIVLIINNQFTSAPNTTQIASGAGRNSPTGNNARHRFV